MLLNIVFLHVFFTNQTIKCDRKPFRQKAFSCKIPIPTINIRSLAVILLSLFGQNYFSKHTYQASVENKSAKKNTPTIGKSAKNLNHAGIYIYLAFIPLR